MPHVVVTGASRGIGRELACRYASLGWQVTAAVREPRGIDLPAGVRVTRLDVADGSAIEAFAAGIAEPIDLLVNNAGIFGSRPQPLAAVTADAWLEVLRVNTVAPVLLTRSLLPQLRAGAGKRIVTISSRMGSLTENGTGDSLMYRSSKAAVNMAMQCLSFEVAADGLGVLLVHPGWVRTDMGTTAAALDVTESVTGIVQVIAAFDPNERLAFRAWDGRDIPW